MTTASTTLSAGEEWCTDSSEYTGRIAGTPRALRARVGEVRPRHELAIGVLGEPAGELVDFADAGEHLEHARL